MSSDSPTISVVMSVYNGQRYLAEAIESILSQTFADFEFIIIDDGSKDDSKKRIEQYAARDARIRLISRANTGLVRALNEGVSLARGQYMARIDADDVALPDRFQKQADHLRNHPDCVALGSRVLLIDSDGAPLHEMPEQLTHEAIDAAHLTGTSQAFYHSSGMFRLEAIRRIGGYREYTYIEDLDLFLRLAEIGRIENLPTVLTKYRQHLESIGHSRMEKQQLAAAAVLADTFARRGLAAPASASPAKPTTLTRAQQHNKWAWWALRAGHVKSARKHARRAVLREPFDLGHWRLLYCATRGR